MLPAVSDILALLDRIPAWKALLALPRRIADLEKRVAALEGAGAKHSAPSPDECPACRLPMRFIAETRHPQFDFAGLKLHRLHRDGCGQEFDRVYDPGKGYGAS